MGKKNALVPTEEADGRKLTRREFHGLADVPPEMEWFANIPNARTRREYADDLRDFMGFVGIARPEEFRTVTRAHVLAWREDLVRRGFAPSSIRRKLSALSSLFEYLCEKNAVAPGEKSDPLELLRSQNPLPHRFPAKLKPLMSVRGSVKDAKHERSELVLDGFSNTTTLTCSWRENGSG